MFIDSLMMRTNYLLEEGLNTESLRRKVIANNIANVDTPHFKRSEVNFESQLKRVIMEQNDENAKLPALMNDRRHIPFFIPRDIHSVRNRVNLDYSTTYRNDGNNVDIEKEMVDGATTTMRYNAFVTSLNSNYRMLKIAMRQV
ncbi:MAG TPA: flagellar basal body rod protein FlgB [Spirochaetota bacterium]|nr:flagellar basal body rod protein FlgB [Syntrophorhabdaceae bacterium]HOW83096.1 flagellar basal body rod protein FlgB [Spirochaetota bacterium]HRZ29035.1 flagellar basal body rod protein FlgB [Spirochaetota bacterium]HSA15560.1 flagellar basal body rod protein FlgB [Spirochaetota bacterium]